MNVEVKVLILMRLFGFFRDEVHERGEALGGEALRRSLVEALLSRARGVHHLGPRRGHGVGGEGRGFDQSQAHRGH